MKYLAFVQFEFKGEVCQFLHAFICSRIIDKPFAGLFVDRVADLSQK